MPSASVWGGEDCEVTCRVSGGTNSTRKDYIFVNHHMWPMVTAYRVVPDADYLMHAVVPHKFQVGEYATRSMLPRSWAA